MRDAGKFPASTCHHPLTGMTARHDARAADAQFRDPSPPLHIGQRVRTTSGIGVIEFIAFSNAMQSPVYTVALDSRIKLRLLARDLIPL